MQLLPTQTLGGPGRMSHYAVFHRLSNTICLLKLPLSLPLASLIWSVSLSLFPRPSLSSRFPLQHSQLTVILPSPNLSAVPLPLSRSVSHCLFPLSVLSPLSPTFLITFSEIIPYIHLNG